MRALIVSADHFEDSELLFPYYRLKEAGLKVDIASVAKGKIAGKHGYEVGVDKTLTEVDAHDYDILVIPGGKAPAALCRESAAVRLAQDFMHANKPVAAICHGPQLLIAAGVLRGRRATCYPSVAEELRQAGARYEDSEAVVDGNLVTARQPADLPAFMRETLRLLQSISP
jgi:protease I